METILCGDALEQLRTLEPESVRTCVTSPPYYNLRDYGVDGQVGMEAAPEEYIEKLLDVFREVRRVLRPDGTLWVNIGDSYTHDKKWGGASGGKHVKALHGNTGIGRRKTHTGLKEKDLIGIPWLLAFALRSDGWYLRQDIIWHKTNAMPESVRDRCTKAHEYIFLLSKSERYYFCAEAISEPITGESTKRYLREGEKRRPSFGGEKYGPDKSEESRTKSGKLYIPTPRRNKRSVWNIATARFKAAHYATFPERLVEPCILAGCSEGGTVLDPFMGSGTTGVVAKRLRRDFVGVEINSEYCQMALDRINATKVQFAKTAMEGALQV